MALLCAAAVVLVLSATRFGAGIGGDGVAYVAGARNILHGLGFSWVGPQGDIRPTTIFGPLFPALLSALGLAGVDPLVGARWLNAGFFGINLALCLCLLCRATGERWVALLGSVLVAFSPVILSAHAGVISEPTFLALLLGGMIALARYLETGRRRWLAASAILAGLSYLARYVGLTAIASGAVILLLAGARSPRRRLADAFIYAFVASIFVVPWFVRNELAGGSATARTLVFLLPDRALLQVVAELVAYWFLPERIPLIWRGGVILAGTAFLGAMFLRFRRPLWRGESAATLQGARNRQWARILAIQLAVYAAGVLTARVLFVPRISIDERILLPPLLLILLLAPVLAWRIWWALGSRHWLSRLAVALVFLLAISNLARGGVRALLLQGDGVGFASRSWRSSPLMNAMSLLPPETPIYTNEVEAVYLLGGRSAYRLPTGCLPEDTLHVIVVEAECRGGDFRPWAEAMRGSLETENAVVALFDTYREQPYYAPVAEELVAGLDVLTSQGDGHLFVQDRGQWPESPHW
jgi:hypothetical protein